MAGESYSPLLPERFPAKSCPGLESGVGTGSRQENASNQNLEPRSDSNGKGCRRYWLLLPVLLFLAGAAAALGVSVLRTAPQGSEDALASGIFLRDSL
jgi:hypothetical protein